MSKFGEKTLKMINPLFPKQIHPFNLQNDGQKTYAMWQYEKGEDTIKFYLDKYTKEEMLKDKDVLDFGCGAGGKSLYYASLGAKSVTGVDIIKRYEEESTKLAKSLGFEDKFKFVLGDATNLPFNENSFDVIIMNDFFEHVSKPESALKEAFRILKPHGKIYLNFPPYNHPFGAHLSDAINVPWVHLFFSEKTMINVYKDYMQDVPDGEERINFRFSKNDKGEDYISYINKMSIKRFNNILKDMNITPSFYNETPLRNIFSPFCKIPGIKESFVKMVTCVIEKN